MRLDTEELIIELSKNGIQVSFSMVGINYGLKLIHNGRSFTSKGESFEDCLAKIIKKRLLSSPNLSIVE